MTYSTEKKESSKKSVKKDNKDPETAYYWKLLVTNFKITVNL